MYKIVLFCSVALAVITAAIPVYMKVAADDSGDMAIVASKEEQLMTIPKIEDVIIELQKIADKNPGCFVCISDGTPRFRVVTDVRPLQDYAVMRAKPLELVRLELECMRTTHQNKGENK